MDFMQKMQDGFNKGLAASRELLHKAKDKAQELGEKGVLKVEIMQLEDQASKLAGKLGVHVFEAFSDGRTSIEKTEEISAIVAEIEAVKKSIEEKERQIKLGV